MVTPLAHDVSGYGASVSGTSGPAAGQPLAGGAGNAPDVAQTGLSGGTGGGSSSRGSLSNLSGTNFPPTKAALAPSRKYLLAHNTYARCVLYTEIVTDQPSLIECPLTEPLYSADGSTVIADAGDRLFGEQSVEVKPGQVRVFTSWTTLETQSGIRANLASLGAGPMGASGTEAWIDNHYMQRFGDCLPCQLKRKCHDLAPLTDTNSDRPSVSLRLQSFSWGLDCRTAVSVRGISTSSTCRIRRCTCECTR